MLPCSYRSLKIDFFQGTSFECKYVSKGEKNPHEKKRNRHFGKVSKSNKWPPPCRAAAVSIFFVHYIRGKHMVLRAGTEHFLPCTVPAQNLYARSSLLADCSWQSLAEAAASETSCWAAAKFISRWILWFMAPGKQGQPDGVTLEGFSGNSFSDCSEDGTVNSGFYLLYFYVFVLLQFFSVEL